jgi:hypothetical protein
VGHSAHCNYCLQYRRKETQPKYIAANLQEGLQRLKIAANSWQKVVFVSMQQQQHEEFVEQIERAWTPPCSSLHPAF